METRIFDQFGGHFGQCFEPTYKEWKQALARRAHVTVFDRFEPTYKEWKHSHRPPPPWRHTRFEPTYKEWKPSPSRIALAIFVIGFEPTYKEWKRE